MKQFFVSSVRCLSTVITSVKAANAVIKLYLFFPIQKSKKPQPSTGGPGIFKKLVDNLKQGSKGDQELNTSLKQFEQKLTEINELESIKKAKEIISQAKADVMKQNEAILTEVKEKAKYIRETTGSAANKVSVIVRHRHSFSNPLRRLVKRSQQSPSPSVTSVKNSSKMSRI